VGTKKCDRNGVPPGSTVGPLLFAKKEQCVVHSGVTQVELGHKM
jgi:hypothetical protein